MASITQIEGLPSYITWDENFQLPSLSIKFKLGSNETVTSKSTSYEIVKLLIGNYTTVAEAEENDIGSVVGIRFVYSDDLVEYNSMFLTLGGDGTFTVAKGGTRTIKSSYSQSDNVTTYLTYSTPHEGDEYTLEGMSLEAVPWFKSKIVEIDGGVARKYPITLFVEVGDATHHYKAVAPTSCYIIDSYVKPTITSMSLFDTEAHNAYPYFGSYIFNVSKPRIGINYTADNIDPTLKIKHRLTVTVDDNPSVEYSKDTSPTSSGSDTVFFDLNEFVKDEFDNTESDVVFDYVVDYEFGYNNRTTYDYSKTKTTITTIQEYERPSVYQLTDKPIVQRYSVATDEFGTPTYFIDELGYNLWMSFGFRVYPLYNLFDTSVTNGWSIKLVDAENEIEYSITSGNNGTSYEYTQNRTLLTSNGQPISFPASNRYNFSLILSDHLSEVRIDNIIVEKGSGYFDVEKHGVGVGMLSTGSANDKKFEVASDYKSIFYGQSFFNGGNGWLFSGDVLTSGSLFSPYSGTGGGYSGVYVRTNGMITELYGTVSKKASSTSSVDTWWLVCTLPTGLEPDHQINVVCQGSGDYIFVLKVNTNGQVLVGRYRHGTTYGSVGSTTWLPFHVVWMNGGVNV